ncbi:hypothetical protein BU16DRAFT_528582 [Lophium mytilinum]|uniref:Uncharacterized protein n=1 Tax=Lophium mytilinum TaxID=390894 RepID=A0A6A6QMF7_9PEZI|nr:hypothetical protein BU16DRAFT_528582 [Lophium mytilinum]
MASGVPAVSDDEFGVDSYAESSPDPLALSWTESRRPTRTRATSKQPPRKTPLRAGSPNKQTQTINATLSSPSKSMIMSTGKAGGVASPWKVKVTVEAVPEQESDSENVGYGSPSHGRTTSGRTTTIPLKDADASSPTRRRGPGRPRKSIGSSPTKAKRSATHVRKKPKARKSTIGVADMSIADISADNIKEEPKRRPGRPKKSVQPEVNMSSAETTGDHTQDETQDEGFVDIRRPQLSRTKTVPVRFSSSELGTPGPTQEHRPGQRLARRGTPVRFGGQHEDTSLLALPKTRGTPSVAPKSVKTRKGTPVRPGGSHSSYKPSTASESGSQIQRTTTSESEGDSLYNSGGRSEYGTTSRSDAGSLYKPTSASESGSQYKLASLSSGSDHEDTPPGSDDGNDADMWRGMVARGLQHGENKEQPIQIEPEAESDDMYDAEGDEDQDADADADYDFENVDHTLAGIHTTIMENENFTMVSIDSLPSYQAMSTERAGRLTSRTVQSAIGKRGFLDTPVQRSDRKSYEEPSQVSIPYISSTGLTPSHIEFPARVVAKPRGGTPAMATKTPSVPPRIEVSQSSPRKTPTPKIARAVKAGFALQGLVDPVQEPSSKNSPDVPAVKEKSHLDNLFNGFGEGTRRELRADFRLGEKIAEMSQELENKSTPASASSFKVPQVTMTDQDVFRSSSLKPRPAQRLDPRLPTPDERDQYSLSIPSSKVASPEVTYPDIAARAQQTHLASPARSEDEMSWRVDTPPVVKSVNPHSQGLHQYLDAMDAANPKTPEAIVVDEEVNEDEPSDIWEEEASRSSDLPTLPKARTATHKKADIQELLMADGNVFPPARGKIPKTWRRKSSSDFHYSDEVEVEIEEVTAPAVPRADQSASARSSKGKGKAQEVSPRVEYDEQEDSESSDDTGMFWESNLPAVYNKSTSLEEQTSKLDLTMLLGGDSSPAKENSVATADRSSVAQKVPPRIAQLQAPPYKGSPLKQQLRSEDLESERGLRSSLASSRNAQSFIGVEGKSSTSSDVRQLRVEAEARSYQPRSRTLHGIEEVTEHPQRSVPDSSFPSSPPEVVNQQGVERSVLSPKRAYPPLFDDSTTQSPKKRVARAVAPEPRVSRAALSVSGSTEPSKAQTGLFSRLTTTLWAAVTPAAPPPPHPTLLRFSPLPRVQPWTRTHYKTLDVLFQIHKRRPTSFAPASPSNINNALLESIPDRKKFLGAVYSNWGYNVTMTEQYLVLAAAFCQLLTLADIKEYERTTGKEIDRGDVDPGPDGEVIGFEAVVRRLFSVVSGEDVRRDEKLGKVIRRDAGFSVTWGC